ncbi:MAG: vWA domain-containing protein [Gemmataceae bacterium]|nr:VWA domain-containing protein [Gemmata sp.]MDW8198322.1 vWA domain-containing protein [Gemmataceae bacterium]
MPALVCLAALPKPLLFGLYGAVGGLLGALLLGEWLMLALGPQQVEAGPPPPEPRLAIAASPELQLYQGGTNKLVIEILRDEFNSAVTVRAEKLPSGITAREVIIPPQQIEAELEFQASHTAEVKPATIALVATAKPNRQTISASTTTHLTVLPSPLPQADIVFVLDVSHSMDGQILGLQDGITQFASDLARAKVDARFGCVAFRDLFHPEPDPLRYPQMKTLRFAGDAFTADAVAFRNEVRKLEAFGGGDIPETSYEAVCEAANLKGWRKGASRVLVLITDAPPKRESVPPRGLTAEEVIAVLRRNEIDLLHLVVHDRNLRFYQTLHDGVIGVDKDGLRERGKHFEFLETANDRDAFTRVLLPEMTRSIVAAAEAKRPQAKPQLGQRPVEKPQLVKAVQSSREYSRRDAWQLLLAVGVWTGAIAAMIGLWLVGGQHYYLRGTLPDSGRVVIALLGGMAFGLIGGAAGQGLVILANVESTALVMFFRLIGWVILGALAGVGLSPFVPNLKPTYGLIGGVLGGFVGGLGYLVIERVGGDVVGRLAGGLMLGLCIGAMVAVVEAVFRQAWLEVHYGPREVVTVNLGPEPVKIGSDARLCTVWARGAANIALRYFIRNGQVICTDVPTQQESIVHDGDTRIAGNVTIVVHMGTRDRLEAFPAVESPARGQRIAPPVKPKPTPAPAPASRPAAPAAAASKPALALADDEEVLPLPGSPVSSPQPVSVSVPTPPPRQPPTLKPPPLPGPGSPSGSSAPPRATPASPPPSAAMPTPPVARPSAATPKAPGDACPGCGRVNPGRPGNRYCMVCDRTY